MMATLSGRAALRLLLVLSLGLAGLAHAQPSRNLAPGFTDRPALSRLLIVPVDMELYSISAGGIQEPKADWTEAAVKNFRTGLDGRKKLLGDNIVQLEEKDLDELAEINALHGAVAQAVFLHHMLAIAKLPTKEGVLDWSMGDSVKPLRDKTGADFALFTWIRDSYASPERKAAMIMMAVLGVGIPGGAQVGYASLVDLQTGRIVWFNDLRRAHGDLREPE
ncbi:MAG: hypothetical protein Q8M91_15400, partial [Polaromonas sp.]|nr:hypothetical protein [Polaromonas sp.]